VLLTVSADGAAPQLVARGIGLEQPEVAVQVSHGIHETGDNVPAVRRLKNGVKMVPVAPAEGLAPHLNAEGVRLEEPTLRLPGERRLVRSDDHVPAVRRLDHGAGVVPSAASVGAAPLLRAEGIRLDEQYVILSLDKPAAGQDVPAVTGLSNGVSPLVVGTTEGGGPVHIGVDGRDGDGRGRQQQHCDRAQQGPDGELQSTHASSQILRSPPEAS